MDSGIAPRSWLRAMLLLLLGLAASPAWGFTTVVIDAGHGGKDPGAAWYGIREKTLCLDTAKRLERLLKANGFNVVMTRRSDVYVQLSTRARIANRYRSAVFVSIHYDAVRNRAVSGFTTHYMSKAGAALASRIQSALDRRIPGHSRGIGKKDLKVLRETKGVAVLVECGFISNRSESRRCTDPDHRQAIAEGIARGLISARAAARKK
jgi:N-acetylmuramoyl-L-alanine amidase